MKTMHWQGGDNDVLVLGVQTGNPERVEDNWLRNKVRVTGTVRGVALVDLERGRLGS
jgi:hypothetical protein